MQRYIANTYEIIEKIGAGNGGTVYKAYHRNLNKYVVLKKVNTDIQDLMNTRTEVDVLKNLKHTCLPQVFNFVKDNDSVYTVMEFIPGKSFKQYLDAGTVFPERSVIIWMKQIASTLAYLHNQDPAVIHSDLKPGNIMLMPNGMICLIDFNISFSLGGGAAYVTGYTNGYAPPEQIAALKYNQREPDRFRWKKIDRRADIYSLGATVYHLLTGQKPVMDKQGRIRPLQKVKPETNKQLAGIVMKCLEPEPGKRYQRAEELLEDLKRLSEGTSHSKKLPLIAGIAAGCVALGAAAFGIGYHQIDKKRQADYKEAVLKIEQCISDGNYEDVDTWYEKAVKIYPGRADAYLDKAEALNREKKYRDCISFIDDRILSAGKVKRDIALDSVYYLMGDSYSQIEEYEKAAGAYESAIRINSENGSYYRDYAIAESYCGNTEKAQELLKEAEDKGLSTADVSYVSGEIRYNTGDYLGAEEIFRNCIQDSKDPYIQMRSYIMTAKCMDQMDDSINGEIKKAELLKTAEKELPKENNIGILEELAQTYSNLGAETGDTEYYKKAIDVFKQIESQGMGDYDTACNTAVLYQNMDDYQNAEKKLKEMLKTYGEDYRTYKNLAFVEVAVQGKASEDSRDYSKFEKYCKKAKELYKKQLSSNANDMEMDRLDDLYEQARESGWIS